MSKINSVEELKQLRDKYRPLISVREKGQKIQDLIQIRVRMGECGINAGAKEVFKAFFTERDNYDLGPGTVVYQIDCPDICEEAPVVEVEIPGKEPVYFNNVNAEKVKAILGDYIKNGKIVDGMHPLTEEEKV